MNIDELVNSISKKESRDDLAHWVSKWKKDETDIYALYQLIAKWHGNVWFQDQDQNNQDVFHANLQKFKREAIDGLGGMTVNERLYWFGLFDEWAQANSNEQERIRNKIAAAL